MHLFLTSDFVVPEQLSSVYYTGETEHARNPQPKYVIHVRWTREREIRRITLRRSTNQTKKGAANQTMKPQQRVLRELRIAKRQTLVHLDYIKWYAAHRAAGKTRICAGTQRQKTHSKGGVESIYSRNDHLVINQTTKRTKQLKSEQKSAEFASTLDYKLDAPTPTVHR